MGGGSGPAWVQHGTPAGACKPRAKLPTWGLAAWRFCKAGCRQGRRGRSCWHQLAGPSRAGLPARTCVLPALCRRHRLLVAVGLQRVQALGHVGAAAGAADHLVGHGSRRRPHLVAAPPDAELPRGPGGRESRGLGLEGEVANGSGALSVCQREGGPAQVSGRACGVIVGTGAGSPGAAASPASSWPGRTASSSRARSRWWGRPGTAPPPRPACREETGGRGVRRQGGKEGGPVGLWRCVGRADLPGWWTRGGACRKAQA